MSEELKKRVGDYELILRIGAGGQASVYRARCAVDGKDHIAKGQHVALKVLRSTEQGRKSERRFRRQVEAFLSLDHPNIVRYLDWFTIQDEMGDELRCLALEFLEGEELKEYMAKYPAGMSWPQLKRVFSQCMAALAYAGGMGMVHRDIKPSNIFLMRDGTAKIIDFGIAKRQDATVTTTAGFKGTFDYMAPDFLKGGYAFRGDALSDIFSIGVCFHEALTGALPYASVSDTGSMGYVNRWHRGGFKGPDVSTKHFRVLSEWAATFVTRCMAENRDERYQGFDEMLADFEKIEPVRVTNDEECYTLTEYLGQGNLAEVFRAQRERDGKVFAVKHLLPGGEPLCFRREGRKLEKFPHANMVAYEGIIRARDLQGEEAEYLVLQFLENVPLWSLRARIDKKGPLDTREVLHHFTLYLRALEYLHEGQMQPIVHGDISPLTLYCPPWDPGHPSGKNNGKLLDLGLEYSEKQEHGFLKPTDREYMAPEFVLDTDFGGSPQSDVYAIGLCLYEALCGERAYPELPKDEEAVRRGIKERAEGAVDVTFEASIFERLPQLAAIIRRALARHPEDRYASAEAMRHELEAVIATVPDEGYLTTASQQVVSGDMLASVPDAEPAAGAPGEPELPELPELPALPEPVRRRRSPLGAVFGVLAAVAVIGAGAYWAYDRFFTETPEPPPMNVPAFEATAVHVASFRSSVEVAERRSKENPDDAEAQRRLETMYDAWSGLPGRFDEAFVSAVEAGKLDEGHGIIKEWSACTESLPFGDLDLAAHKRRKDSMQRRLGYAEKREVCLVQELSVEYAGRLEACLEALKTGREDEPLPEAKDWWAAQSRKLDGSIAGLAGLTANMIRRHLVDKQDMAAAESVAAVWQGLRAKSALMAAMPGERTAQVVEAARSGLQACIDGRRKKATVAIQAGDTSAMQEYEKAVQELFRSAPLLVGLSGLDPAAPVPGLTEAQVGYVLGRVRSIETAGDAAQWPTTLEVLGEVAGKLSSWAGDWPPQQRLEVEAEGMERVKALAESFSKDALAANAKGDGVAAKRSEGMLRELCRSVPAALGAEVVGDMLQSVQDDRERVEKKTEAVQLVLKRLDDLGTAFADSAPGSWPAVLTAWASSVPPAEAWGDAAVTARWQAVAPRVRAAIGKYITSSSTTDQLDIAGNVIRAAQKTVLEKDLKLPEFEAAWGKRHEEITRKPEPVRPPDPPPVRPPPVRPPDPPPVTEPKTVFLADSTSLPEAVKGSMRLAEQLAAREGNKRGQAISLLCGCLPLARVATEADPDRVEWQELLAWERQMRETHPWLGEEGIGASRLSGFEKDVRGLVGEQAKWRELQRDLAKLPDKSARIKRIDRFIEFWKFGLYLNAAKRIRAGLDE
jgi:serine/threonine protein kinase